MIAESDILHIQKLWSDGLLKIVETHQKEENFILEASNFIDTMYAYDSGEVLFKPTLASEQQFRFTKEGALSYFVGHNLKFPEDSGFALKGWQSIRWENARIKIYGDIAISIGNYYFLKPSGDELKVEFSFVYKLDKSGGLKIILHDSHLPYSL